MSKTSEICDTCRSFSGKCNSDRKTGKGYYHMPTGWCMKLKRSTRRNDSCGNWKPDGDYEYVQVAEVKNLAPGYIYF